MHTQRICRVLKLASTQEIREPEHLRVVELRVSMHVPTVYHGHPCSV